MKRACLAPFVAAMLLGASPAGAVSTTLCIRYGTAFGDDYSAGDDWTGYHAVVTARGIHLQVWENGGPTLFSGYTNADTGCKTLDMSTSESYTIRVKTQAELDSGNNTLVESADTEFSNVFLYDVDTNFVPAGTPQTEYFTYPYYGESELGVNVAAAAGYGVHYRNGGIDDEIWHYYTETCPSGSGSCTTNDSNSDMSVFLSGFGTERKYIIAHETGHLLGYIADEESSPILSYACPNGPDCEEFTDTVHDWTSKEYQTAAAVEGFAHYFAAALWNDREDDCEYYYYKEVDFDPRDSHGDGEAGDLYSCESGGAFMEDECGTPYDDRGVEVDWLRFWWDLYTDQNVSHDSIVDIWDGANPRSWNLSIVYSRLRDAADAEGVDLNDWDEEAEYNGVDW
jgi:hypothetical protein